MVGRISGVGFDSTARIKRESHNLRVGLSRGKAAGRTKKSNIIQNGQEIEGNSLSSDVMYSIDGVDATSLTATQRRQNMSLNLQDPMRISRQDISNTARLTDQLRKFQLPFASEQEYLKNLFDTVDWKQALETETDTALRQVLQQAFPDQEMSPQMETTLMNWIKTIQTVGLDNINYELRRLMMKFQYQQKRKKNPARKTPSVGLLDALLGFNPPDDDNQKGQNTNDSHSGSESGSGSGKKKKKDKKGKK